MWHRWKCRRHRSLGAPTSPMSAAKASTTLRRSGSARTVTKSRFTRTSTTNRSQSCISAATRARSGVSARPTSQMRSPGSTQSRVTGLAERTRTPHLTSRKERAPTLYIRSRLFSATRPLNDPPSRSPRRSISDHSKSGALPTSAWRAPAFVWASGTPPSDTAARSGPGRALALQFAHPHLGHESKYTPILTRQRKEPCP